MQDQYCGKSVTLLHQNSLEIQASTASQQLRKLEPTMTVFVRLPSGKTTPVRLMDTALVADLYKHAADLSSASVLAHKGVLMSDQKASLLKYGVANYSTVHVQSFSPPLLGGSKKAVDPPPDAGDSTNAGQTSQQSGPLTIKILLSLRGNEDDQVEMDEQIAPENKKWRQFFESDVPKSSKELGRDTTEQDVVHEYKLYYKKQNKLLEPDNPDQDNLATVFEKYNISEAKKQGELIEIEVERISNKSAERLFIRDIPFFTADMKKYLQDQLYSRENVELIKSYAEKEHLQNLTHEDVRKLLIVLSEKQRSQLLFDLQKKQPGLDKVLEFLLKKNGQWTKISAQVNMASHSSNNSKRQIASRIMMKKQITFKSEDETEAKEDQIIVDLLLPPDKDQSLIPSIWKEMQTKQKVYMLLYILTEDKFTKILEYMLVNCPQKISDFWDSLDKAPRMLIWSKLSNETKLKLLFSQDDENSLDNSQSKRLWDNIGSDNRCALWEFIDNEITKKNFLAGMTTMQQVTLWSVLEKDEKVIMFRLLGEMDKVNQSHYQQDLWRTMSHQGRAIMIKQLQPSHLKDLFTNMQIEDRALLLGMINDSIKDQLLGTLNQYQKNDLFFYQEFNMKEKTRASSKQYVDDLLERFYADNNQRTPFARIEGGYVQCIHDPKVKNGFITVQIVNPIAETLNKKIVKKKSGQEDFYELETDEAREQQLNKKRSNNDFRLVENRYGRLKEFQPNHARNADNLGIISFWQFSEERGFWCHHSFYVSNPVEFIVKDQESIYKNILYRGRNDEIFFFNSKESKQAAGSEANKTKEQTKDLRLCILTHQIGAMGELSRDALENCSTHRIHQSTDLYKYIMQGNFTMKLYNNIYFMNSVPTLINDGDLRFLVYSKCGEDDIVPTTYFYDVQESLTLCSIPGAEVFIDYFTNPDETRKDDENFGYVYYMTNKWLTEYMLNGYDKTMPEYQHLAQEEQNQNEEEKKKQKKKSRPYLCKIQDQKNAGKFYGKTLSAPEYDKQSEIIRADLNLRKLHEKLCQDRNNHVSEQKFYKFKEKDGKFESAISECGYRSIQMLFDNAPEDLRGMDRWRQRYSRDSVLHVIVQPFQRDVNQGFTKTFTLLFENYFSLTFTISDDAATLKKRQEEEKQKADERKDEEIKKQREEQKKQQNNQGKTQLKAESKGNNQKKGNKEEQIEQIVVKKEQNNFGKGLEDKEFRAMYFVPDAQFVIVDTSPQQFSEDDGVVTRENSNKQARIYVQTCARQEADFSQENIFEQNALYVKLYNISDDIVRNDTRTKVPMKIKVQVLVNRDAIESYTGNQYGTRHGAMNVKAMIMPIQMTTDGHHGAILYQDRLINIQVPKIHWFKQNKFRLKESKIHNLMPQKVQIDYPLMLYKSFSPDNRELILANLADKEQPQKVLHLFNLQFICFVGHNCADKRVKLGFLAIDDDQVKLCWLQCSQPFEKKQPNSYDDYGIVDTTIRFTVPVLDKIQEIQRVEFVRYKSDHISESRDEFGALLIQTTNQIYFSHNETGYHHYVMTNDSSMVPILMLRGHNSHFYYVEKSSSGTDQVVMEFKAKIVSKEWEFDKKEIYKVNEGKIIALEIDPENTLETDSIYTNDRNLIEERPEVKNVLYLVNDSQDLVQIAQDEEGAGSKYSVQNYKDLSVLKNIQSQFNEYKQMDFSSMSITERCITFNEINYNFANGMDWSLNISTKEIIGNELVERDSDTDSENEGQAIAEESPAKNQKKIHYKIHSVSNVRWTQRQLIIMTVQSQDEDDKWQSQDFFITKMLPGTRRSDLVGIKGRRDMESINLISDDKYLIKLISHDDSGQLDYWTVVDKYGQIHEMPNLTQDVLKWSVFSAGVTRQLDSGCLVILKGGEKSVLSATTSVAVDETRISLIEFDRNAEVITYQTYHKENFEAALKSALEHDIIQNYKQLFDQQFAQKPNLQDAQSITRKIVFSDMVLTSNEGDLYRIATVVDARFNDFAAVNVLEEGKDTAKDDLNTGLYVVRPSIIDIDKARFLKMRDKELKIILFLCKNKADQRAVQNSGFTISGRYLCWQYPDRSVVNVLDLAPYNNIRLKQQELLDNIMDDVGFEMVNQADATVDQIQENIKSRQNDLNNLLGDDKNTAGTKNINISSRQQSRDNSILQSEDDVFAGELEFQESVGLRAQKREDKRRAGLNRQISSISIQNKKNTRGKSIIDRFRTKSDRTFFNRLEDYEFVSSSAILWCSNRTRTLDLSVMMQSETDSRNTRLMELPNSIQMSIQRQPIKVGEKIIIDEDKKSTKKNEDQNLYNIDLKRNLLQVTVNNQVIVFDLSETEPKEVMFFNATNQFINPEKYVESGIQMGRNIEVCATKSRKGGHIFDYIVASRDKTAYFHRRDRVTYSKETQSQEGMERPPVCLGMFKSYAEVDLIQLKRVQTILEEKRNLDFIDFQAIVGMYEGHTIFSIFHDEEKLYEQILLQLQETEWENETQEDESEIQNNVLRRLYRILTLPVPDMIEEKVSMATIDSARNDQSIKLKKPQNRLSQVLPEDPSHTVQTTDEDDQKKFAKEDKKIKKGIYSVLQKSLFHPSLRIRDILMSITNICEECQLSNFAQDQEDMKILFQNVSANFLELVQDSFVETTYTKKIQNILWYTEAYKITFRLNKSILTEKECEEQVVEELQNKYRVLSNRLNKTQVEVRMVNIDWLLAERNSFVNFVYILKQQKSEKIYQTELLEILLEEFWEENFMKIFNKILIPWVCWMLCSLYFFMTILEEGYTQAAHDNLTDRLYEYILSVCVVLSLVYQLYIEFIQSYNVPFIAYFTNYSNLIDIYCFGVSLWIVVVSLAEVEFPSLEYQRIMAAIALLFMWIKVLDWLRLFQETSFFIRLIFETIYDIRYFVTIFLVALASFGCSIYMLQLNVPQGGDDVLPSVSGQFLIDVLYNQYMLSLGEFEMDGFDNHPQKVLCYIFFLSATFFTQITFLNMLIAIMGDTFGRVFENKAQFGLMTKLSIMGDYTVVIEDKKAEQDKRNFLFIVRPKSDGGDEGDQVWEGGLGLIKQAVEGYIKSSQMRIQKDIQKINVQNMETKTRDAILDKEVRKQYNNITSQFFELRQKNQESNSKFQQQIEQTMRNNKNLQEHQIQGLMDLVQEIKNKQESHQSSQQKLLQQEVQKALQQRDGQEIMPLQSVQSQQQDDDIPRLDRQMINTSVQQLQDPAAINKIMSRLDQIQNSVQENESLIKQNHSEALQQRDTRMPPLSQPTSLRQQEPIDNLSLRVETLADRQNELQSKVDKMGGQVKQMSGFMQELRTSQQAFEFNFNQQMTAMNQFLNREQDREDDHATVINQGRQSALSQEDSRAERDQFRQEIQGMIRQMGNTIMQALENQQRLR